MSQHFSEEMTSNQLRARLFQVCEGKSKEEKEKIMEEYREALFKVMDRYAELRRQGWLIDE